MLLPPCLHDLGKTAAGALQQFRLRRGVENAASSNVLDGLYYQRLGFACLIVAPQAETLGQRHRHFAVEEECACRHRLDFLGGDNVFQPVREQPGVDMTLYQLRALQGNLGHAHGRGEGPERVIEHTLIVRGVLTNG
ncbi:hypothetical protein D9M69_553670 [compost metagenome]